eukprot:snap_masked-scaffold_41-processed-gene-2.79-mRNA-1 protein AED:1.00 eAED:1.00 QI:0/0/0/0/1/1/2/0/677
MRARYKKNRKKLKERYKLCSLNAKLKTIFDEKFCLFVDISEKEFAMKLPLELEDIGNKKIKKGLITCIIESAKTKRQDIYVPVMKKVWDTVQSYAMTDKVNPKKYKKDIFLKPFIFCFAGFVEIYLRQYIENTLAQFIQTLQKFSGINGPTNLKYIFPVLYIHCKVNGSKKPVIKLLPNEETLNQLLLECTSKVVESSHNLYKVGTVIFHSRNKVSKEDTLFKETIFSIKELVSTFFSQSETKVKVDSEEERLRKLMTSMSYGKETKKSLKLLRNALNKYRDTKVEACATDRSLACGLFRINVEGLIQQIEKRCLYLISIAMEHIIKLKNLLVKQIISEFDEMCIRLNNEPNSSEELRLLITYSKKSEKDVKASETKCVTEINPLVIILTEYDHFLSEGESTAFNYLQNYFARMWTTIRKSEEVQETDMEQRVKVLERRLDIFKTELNALEARIEDFKDLDDIDEESALANCHLVAELKDKLIEAENEIKGINRQEELLEQARTEETWKKRHLNLTRSLQPFFNLWTEASNLYEFEFKYHNCALCDIDIDSVKTKLNETKKNTLKAIKVFEKEVLTVPLAAAQKILTKVNIFEENYLPVLDLLCNSNLKARQWRQMETITGLDFSELKTYSGADERKAVYDVKNITLANIISTGLHEKIDDIQAICQSMNGEKYNAT